jgi:Fe2+ or Zn2+ uptake regulation protein
MQKTKKELESRGISPSLQRVIILKYLLRNKEHPTAEDIYSSLSRQIPTLSKTTVYNTLKLYTEKGLIKQLVINGNEHHYEANLEYHAHFHCNKCGKIYDLDLEYPEKELKTIEGHEAMEAELVIRGICRECKEE